MYIMFTVRLTQYDRIVHLDADTFLSDVSTVRVLISQHTIKLCYVVYDMLCSVLSCYDMLYYVMLYYVMLYYAKLFYVMSYCAVSPYDMLCHVITNHIVSYHFMPHYFFFSNSFALCVTVSSHNFALFLHIIPCNDVNLT